MNKSIADVNREQKEKFGTTDNTYKMFEVGDKVRVVCVCSDFNFFRGTERGVVTDVSPKGWIDVDFHPGGAKEGCVESFTFKPSDLLRLAPLSKEQYVGMTSDLVEKHFPKGKCKERGQAMVLVAEILNGLIDTDTVAE